MIEKISAYKSSDGKMFGTIEEIQKHELGLLFKPEDFAGAPVVDQVAQSIMRHKDRIMDILTTTSRSKPKARSINGGTRKRTPKVVQAPAVPS